MIFHTERIMRVKIMFKYVKTPRVMVSIYVTKFRVKAIPSTCNHDPRILEILVGISSMDITLT
jgi:hypothetical protein